MGVWSRVHGSERLLTPSNSRFRCGGIGGSDSPIRRMLPWHQAMAPVDYANSPSNDWWQWMAVSVTIDKATHYVPAPFAVRLLQWPQARSSYSGMLNPEIGHGTGLTNPCGIGTLSSSRSIGYNSFGMLSEDCGLMLRVDFVGI